MQDINTTLLFTWFEEVWNQDKREEINNLMDNNVIAHGLILKDRQKVLNLSKSFTMISKAN